MTVRNRTTADAGSTQSTREETAQECAERMGVPYRQDDRPELWAMARVGCEKIGIPWDTLPYFLGNGDTDQLLRLVYAKLELEGLREIGFDVVPIASGDA